MIISVPLNRIKPNPWQTRIAEPGAEYIKDLALDIARNGLLQTPIGRLMVEGVGIIKSGWEENIIEMKLHEGNDVEVQLAFGHNRLAAYLLLSVSKDDEIIPGDWFEMPVEVRYLTDEQMAMLAWSENEKRRDVTPIERAKAIQKRLDDFKWSNREAAEALGIDHSTISNILRLLKLPEDFQVLLQNGEISERQATAILVLFELPEIHESYFRKNDIIWSARYGVSSDQLREKVDSYLSYYGKKLEQAEFKLSQLIPEGGPVYCGTCSTCDKRMANRNLCFGLDCFEAKTEFVRRKYLEQASFLSGYGILDPNKGGNPSHISDYNGEMEKIQATKCPNLVLVYAVDKCEDVAGFPHARLVCEKRNNSCSCLAGLRANERLHHDAAAAEYSREKIEIKTVEHDEPVTVTMEYIDRPPDPQPANPSPALPSGVPLEREKAGPSSKDLEEAARQARKDKKEALERRQEIQDLVEERLVQALKEDAPGVFYLIAHQSTYVSEWSGGLDLENSYQKIAHALASYPVMPSNPDSLAEMIRQINDTLARLQLEPIKLEKTLMEVLAEEEVVDG